VKKIIKNTIAVFVLSAVGGISTYAIDIPWPGESPYQKCQRLCVGVCGVSGICYGYEK